MYKTLIKIRDKSLFDIDCGNGKDRSFGCNQNWYQTQWQRNSGCGPTTAANMFYYYAQMNPSADEKLALSNPARTKEYVLEIMNKIWEYVTPTRGGLYSTELFVTRVERFAVSRKLPISCKVTNVPNKPFRQKICMEEFISAIYDGLAGGYPLAFLNLSKGKLDNLHHWHWVTLMSLEESVDGNYFCLASDEGEEKMLNMKLWFETSTLGGGIVAFMV